MTTEISPSLYYHDSGIYEQILTTAADSDFEQMIDIMLQVINCLNTYEPMYLVQEASRLDLVYTPRVREFVEHLSHQLRESGKIVRVAVVLPPSFGTCTDFLNLLLRKRETPQSRHLCFTNREDAFTWLEALKQRESRPAVQGF